MYEIVSEAEIASKIKSYEVYAPEVAKNAKAGQFIIFRTDDKSERVPLTITGTRPKEGLVRLIFKEVGKSTMGLGVLRKGDRIKDFIGPLGHPVEIKKFGTVAAIAEEIGVAEVLPVIKELKNAGNKVITIVGAKCKDSVVLEKELKEKSDSLISVTNGGMYGLKGFVTDILKDIADKEEINMVYASCSTLTMKAISGITAKKQIKTIVFLKPIMLDGVGMCGSCRVSVNGETKFACVNGPAFDAHSLHWQEIAARQALFKDLGKVVVDKFKYGRECKCRKE